jgi:hypothetical protein
MSGLSPGADIARPPQHVRNVPRTDVTHFAGRHPLLGVASVLAFYLAKPGHAGMGHNAKQSGEP